jgi:hypothetical protein
MTSRQRLLAAYAHKPVDKIPCSPRMNAWMNDHYGSADLPAVLRAKREFGFDPHIVRGVYNSAMSLSVSRTLPPLPRVQCRIEETTEGAYRALRRVFQTPDGDLTDLTCYPPAGDRAYGISPNPFRTEHLVKDAADLKRLRWLARDADTVSLAPYFDAEKAAGEEALVMLNIMSSLCHRTGDAFPMTDLMAAYYDDRAFFDELLDIGRREMLAEVDAALKAGVRHFFANWYYNSLSAGWSPRIWQSVFAPELAEMARRIHARGGTLNFYDDGKCMPLLEAFADTGIDTLQTLVPPPVGDVDLAAAKRRIGARVCLMGHIDLLYVVQRGTPELIERTVKDALAVGGAGGGFILGTSDSIRDGTPLENVQAYFRAALAYGQASA